ERLNTTRTEAGETTLADWLRSGAPAAEVRARQAAVTELRPLLDFREDVAVLAAESPVGRTGVLADWAASPPAGLPGWLRPALAAAAAVTGTLAILAWFEIVATSTFVFWALASSAVAAVWRKRVDHVLHAIETPERDLGLLAALLHRIETQSFD